MAHLYAVPFENLDIHAGVPIILDQERILEKVVEHRRGGFCYELNGAFAWLLKELGYRVNLLSANVWGSENWGIDFDHMTLRVELDEPWLVDVGFGDSFLRPLRLVEGVEQEEETGVYRLVHSDDDFWILQRRQSPDEELEALYRFTLQSHRLADFEPGCTYHQASPSPFAESTICSLAREWGRITLRADRLIRTEDGVESEIPIEDEAAWRQALADHFGINGTNLIRE